MMAEHSFGGPWTELKLKCLRDYLNAYRTIFTANPKARYFRTWYVDAFAGTGTRAAATAGTGIRAAATDNIPARLFDIYEDRDANTEAQEYQDGSAKIALGLPSPFDNYLFIEKSRKRVGELQAVIQSDFSQLFDRCQFRTGDANAEIKEWCAARGWSKERAALPAPGRTSAVVAGASSDPALLMLAQAALVAGRSATGFPRTSGQQPGIGGDRGAAKLEHQPAVKIEPQRAPIRFTRRVRHRRLIRSPTTP
jgi:hypothetical protein